MITKYYINAGVGYGNSTLTSFDNSLLHAGVGNYNLVRVSSILPPKVKKCNEIDLETGQVLHTAYASITSNEEDTIISAAIGIGIPENQDHVGVIMEFSGKCSKRDSEKQVENMIKEAMINRNYSIKTIIITSSEAKVKNNRYATAFAGVAMWGK